MRYVLLAFAGLLFVVPVARADDAADAKAIIEKAIKARGDKPDSKLTAMTWKEKGKFTGGGIVLPYTADWAFQAPDKYRFTTVGDFGEVKLTITVTVNGEKAWGVEGGGKAVDFTDERLAVRRNEAYQLWVTALAPLTKDNGFTLATAKGKDVDGKPTVAVKVTRDKKPVVLLYFDRDNGLLVKTEVTVKDEAQKWKEVLDEAFFGDYKEQDGQKVYTKMRIVRDGKPLLESTLSDAKAHEKLDPKLFEKP